MTTYNTYQEAKIANPERLIHKYDGKFTAESISEHGHSLQPCNPADHCMTVEEFIASGHKGSKGDLILFQGSISKLENPALLDKIDPEIDSNAYILRAAALEEKKPRTKVEYVKVTDSIFDLRPDFENGELYESICGSVLENEADFIYAYQHGHLRRRIETPMTERDEFIDTYAWAVQDDKSNVEDIAGMLYDSGKFKLVN